MTTQTPVMELTKLALHMKARVAGSRRWVAPRNRYALHLLGRLVRLREVSARKDLQRKVQRKVKQESGNAEAGGGDGGSQGERDDD